jgi:hypothetical protein
MLNSGPRFTKEQWSAIPLTLRRRYWRETDYGRYEMSAALDHEIKRALNGRTTQE